jgi:asparagine synthetase B (glutamine-hydrolysing)
VTAVARGSSLTPLEIASGIVFGVEDAALGPVVARSGLSARDALEAAVLPALQRPPCVVSFSGGLDSSAVLAVASSVARREGLPLPVAVTLRFPGNAEADETSWQESVVSAVPVGDWDRIEIRHELSVVGPVATEALREHGLLWPFNAYVHVPVFERARGGSVLTGFGGDELFAPSRWDRVAMIAAGRTRPTARDLRLVALALAPRPVRVRALRHRSPLRLPWLSLEGQTALARAWALESAAEPRKAARRASWRLRLRSLRTAYASLGSLAAARDVAVLHPLADPALVAAVAALRTDGGRERGELVRALLGDLLPAGLYTRRTKASFNTAFWGEDERVLVASWSGEGVDLSLVDVDAVRATWSGEGPDGRSFTMLQSAWLTRAYGEKGASRGVDAWSREASPTIADGESRRQEATRAGEAHRDRPAGA